MANATKREFRSNSKGNNAYEYELLKDYIRELIMSRVLFLMEEVDMKWQAQEMLISIQST